MVESKKRRNGFSLLGIALATGVILCACQTQPEGEATEAGDPPAAKTSKKKGLAGELESSGANLSFLMTMNWAEAKAISKQAMELPPFFRVAAETLEVVKSAPDGRPLAVRAKGNVFIEMLFKDVGRVLCREAYISEQEVIMRGRPLLQRGGSVVEGVDDLTVFYMLGPKLRVIGRHRLDNESQMIAAASSNGMVERPAGGGFATLPAAAPALPMSGPWSGGPNPLLPPLSPASVSDSVRKQLRAEADAVEVIPLEPPGEAATPATPPARPIPPQPMLEPTEEPAQVPVPALREPES